MKNRELLDIVDEYDNIIGVSERDIVHREKLLHRSVHIFVFNSKGEIFVQKRAATKSEHPGKYDSSAAGHIDTGESYDDAAKRELIEELSIDSRLELLAKFDACSKTDGEFVQLYTTICDNEIKIDLREIEEGHFWEITTLKDRVNSDESVFTPAFILLFEYYLKHAI